MDLKEVRVEIDKVDNEIKRLFEKRMILADNVARVKAETVDCIFKLETEVETINKLTKDIEPHIEKEYTAFIKKIMEVSRKYQYGKTLTMTDPLKIDFKTGPVERSEYHVIGEEKDICRKAYDYEMISEESFDDIAKVILNNPNTAGIGVMEDLGIGVSDRLHTMLINNDIYINSCKIVVDNNVRKKVVTFSKDLVVTEGDNRLKLMFVCPNRSGSLASILSMIADYDINLTEIHSVPDRSEIWNYFFMIELDAAFTEESTKALIYQLMNETEAFRLLGSYKC